MSLTCRGYALALAGVLAVPVGLDAQHCERASPERVSLVASSFAVGGIALAAVQSSEWGAGRDTSFNFIWNGSRSGGQNHLLYANLAYTFSQGATLAWEWSCLSPAAAGWLGALVGFAVLLPKEITDGFSTAGFSGLSAVSAALGAAMPAIHRSWRPLRAIAWKGTYWPSSEFIDGVAPSFPRVHQDYAGQRYFFALNPGLAYPGPGGWPDWLGVAVGHGVAEVYGGPVARQWFFTLDLNLRGLPIRSRGWQSFASLADRLHIPLPGIRLQDGEVRFGLY